MIYLKEIQKTVNDAYRALGEVQYMISVKEPVSSEPVFFTKRYNISTRIIANLEYINMLDLNETYIENKEIEGAIYALRVLIDKVKRLCH